LQLGFGLYQLISQDARYSIERDGLASPFLIVLPYLGMAAVNTVINTFDPPYEVVTVLNVSERCQEHLKARHSPSLLLSPRTTNGYTPSQDRISERSVSIAEAQADGPLEMPHHHQSPGNLAIDTHVHHTPGDIVTSPTTTEPPTNTAEDRKWNEFVKWLEFAYEKRLDVSPVDRLYKRNWISHSLIIGEFIYTTCVGFGIPLVMLAVVGGWTRFQTSNYGLSLAFNLMALFGLPIIQFMLYLRYLVARVRSELKSRKQYGTFYSEGKVSIRSRRNHRYDTQRAWWKMIGESVGIYFPTGRRVVIGYAFLVLGVSICEFTFVGINLQRTLSCEGALI